MPPNDTHSKAVGYVLWIFGFLGAHRFYYGKPVTGTIWFFTLGLLGIGWIIDLFLIPSMDRQADLRFHARRDQLHDRLGAADLPRLLRRAPLLHGQVVHRPALPADASACSASATCTTTGR